MILGSFPNHGPETSSRNGKMNFDKGKIDRQLAGQNIKKGFNKKVTFNTTDGIEEKIDKLTVMMGRLMMEDEGQNRQFKSQVYQSNRGRGQTRCNYDQRRFQDRFRPNNAYTCISP